MDNYLAELLAHRELKPNQLSAVFGQMLKGELNEAQTAGFLVAWRLLGENADLLLAGASQLRAHATALKINEEVRPLSDNCGTGGSGFPKFNVSTTAAVLAASMGIRVAKHGNRSVSGVCGSADLLFAAGLKNNLGCEKVMALLEETGFGFFFAPEWHPMMKYVMPARKNLAVRSIFNVLGPLANPLKPEFQLLGVAEKNLLLPIAKTMQKLGVKKALVVHARDGLDEISTAVPTDMIKVEKNRIKRVTFDPKKFKISGKKQHLKSSGVEENLNLFFQTLHGEKTRVQDAVALNCGALLWLNGKANSIFDGFKISKEKLLSKSSFVYFNHWLETAKRYANENEDEYEEKNAQSYS